MRRTTKLMFGLLAVASLAGATAWVVRVPLGTFVYGRIVASRAGRDASAGLPDGLHVILCGSGSPLPDPSRAGPCTMVIAGPHVYVVDAGEGGARNLTLMGLPVGRIDRLFMTHFHSDHIDGMGPLLLLRWSGAPNTSPLPVAGPPGVEGVVAGFNTAYAADARSRTAHHGTAIMPPSGAGGIAIPFVIGTAPVVVWRDGDVRVTAFAVDHGPVKPAVGYRFDYRGRSMVISGDTAPTPAVAAVARGADLLVHEALQPRLVNGITEALASKGVANTAQITRDILNYHSSPEAAADAAHSAGVRALLLTHIVPPLPYRWLYPAFLGAAADRFGGPITVGEDGTIMSLPTGSDAIVTGNLLP